MSNKIKDMRKKINITFDIETYEKIKNLGGVENKSMAEIVRDFTIQGLNGSLTESNLQFITPIIREQLSNILNPKVERLAALSAKTCVMAATSAYLNAETLSKFVPENSQMDFQDAYIKARKKAIAYTKGRVDGEDEED